MKKRGLLVLTSLAGVINGIWMLILHVRYDKLGGVCAINEKISCEVLTYKQYSEWFGIPTPLFALLIFLILFVLALRGSKKMGATQVKEDSYTWFLATISLVAAACMAYVSFVILHKLCIFCFIFYIIIVSTWFLANSIMKDHGPKRIATVFQSIGSFYENRVVWIVLVICFATVAVAKVTLKGSSHLSNEVVDIRGDEVKVTGNPNAKVSIVIFSDFQCPACKRGAEILKQVEQDYASKVKITYKFFPLDPECNPGAPYGQHLMACDAARAALCAGQQGKFWRFHDRLFESQETLFERKFVEFAQAENLDMTKFNSCIESKQAMETVTKDAEEGAQLNIDSTPTLFFNGKKFEGQVTVEAVKKMIDSF